ncbi:MAG: sulfatase [Bacteroidota bacterium]
MVAHIPSLVYVGMKTSPLRDINRIIQVLMAICLLSYSPYVGAQETAPNVIIMIADDVSWDDIGCYGNSQVKTPNIDALAAEGLMFTNAYLTTSSCSPSRNSIMTGRYPHNTGAAELHTEPPIDFQAFPELLRKEGYFSLQAGKFHMGAYAEGAFDVIYRKREETGDGGEKLWLKGLQERPKDKPFFMWFAAYDAHRVWGPNEFSGTHSPDSLKPPFYLAEGKETRKDLAQYYDEIHRFDHYVGEVAEELKRQEVFEQTLIIIMADNGRPFPHSKTRVNDRGLKTPFIISWPERITQKGQSCEALVSAIDIAPTILALADVEIPENIQGVSFEHVLNSPEKAFRTHVFGEHNWHDYEAHERMVRNDRYMYILNSRPNAPQMGPADAVQSPSHKELNQLRAKGELSPIQADIFMVPRPREELYDLETDPQQLVNVASVPSYEVALEEMRNILGEWMEETGDDVPAFLTEDWYLHEAGYIRTAAHGKRGEMPGASRQATEINAKGKF